MPNSDDVFIHRGRHLEFLRNPRGWEYVHRVSGLRGVSILAMTNAGRVLLIEQERPPLGCAVIELPAGLAAPSEDGGEAARRELQEETGYHSDHIDFLCQGPTSPGLTDETAAIYMASGLTSVRDTALNTVFPDGSIRHRDVYGLAEEGEHITVYEVPMNSVIAWLGRRAREGTVVDIKVYAGLFFAVTGP